jgi:exosortase A
MAQDLSPNLRSASSVAAARPWRLATTALAVSTALFLVLFSSTAATMANGWRYTSGSHGFLVIPIFVYLVWQRRRALRRITPRPCFWGLAMLAIFTFMWLLGTLAEAPVVKVTAFIAMFVCLVWTELGKNAFFTLLFPLTFLFFAAPVGDSLIPWLQDFTVWLATKMLDLAGVPVLLEGRILTVPSGIWEVAAVCSGLRYLTASMFLGYLFAGMVLHTWSRRILFFSLSIIIPIVANGLRVFGIVMLSEHRGNAAAAYTDHLIYGWLFFTAVTVILLGIGWALRERNVAVRRTPSDPAQDNGSSSPRLSVPAFVVAVIAVLAVLTAGPLAASALHTGGSATSASSAIVVSEPWARSNADMEWETSFVGTPEQLREPFSDEEQHVVARMAIYAPGPGARLASSQNSLFDAREWRRVSERHVIKAVNGKPTRIHETVIRADDTALVIWSWYWIDGEFTDDDYRAKFLLAKAALLRHTRGSAFIAIATSGSKDHPHAGATLENFLSHASFFGGT